MSFASALEQVRPFNINKRPADAALIEFAKQANLTIVFPYNKVQDKKANALVGEFTIKTGINMLLLGTGLQASFETDQVVTIKRISIEVTSDANRSIIAKFFELFTLQGKDIVTFPPPVTSLERIEVKGLRNSLNWALALKQSSTGVSDSIQAEEIGKFPDVNLAESLQRISGVSIDRAEGEGQFVTVRGFGPEFNAVQSNGRSLATDNRGREFSFDTIAPELVRSITVDKTFSASQPSGGIGSVINIETARPFASKEFKVAGSLKATFDGNSKQTTPHGTIFFSNSNDKLGWLFSLSHQERQARINEAQTDAWLLNTNINKDELLLSANNSFVPRNYDQRVRFENRTRTGSTAVIQYRPFADVEISLDYLSSKFEIETDSTSLGHWFTPSNLEEVITDKNGTALSFSQNTGHATDYHSRTFDRPSSIGAIGLNTTWKLTPKVLLELDLSKSNASTKDTTGARNALTLIGYLNRSSYTNPTTQILPVIKNFESASDNIVDALGRPRGVSDYLDPSNGRAHVMLRRGWNIKDTFDQIKLDSTLFDIFAAPIDLKLGMLFTQQFKRNERWDNEKNAVHCSFCGYFPTPDLPDSFQTIFDAGSDFLKGISGSQDLPKLWLRHDGAQLFDFLESNSEVDFSAVLRDNSFTISEKVSAFYIEANQDIVWRGIDLSSRYGVRFENTQLKVTGFESDLIELTILDQTELGQISSAGTPIVQSAQYNNWLPSITLKAEYKEGLVARMGISRSLTRPTMTQLSPSLVINTTRQGGDLRASAGSPNLKPFESTNFDLTLEWYYQDLSYISASYFHKRVSNFIVETVSSSTINSVTDPSTGDDLNAVDINDQIAQFDITTPINGPTASVSGFEFAAQYDTKSGWGVIANTTIVNSNAKLDPSSISQKFALTGLSDSKNLILYFENDVFQTRLTWNHRDAFLQSLVQIQGPEPTYVRDYQQYDVSASYNINEYYSLFFEGINITRENVLKHGRFDNQFLLAQQPGARYAIGIRGKF